MPDLGRLLDEAASGEDVLIEGNHGASVRLVPVTSTPDEEEEDEDLHQPIGHALDRYIGTWSAKQEAEVLHALKVFERVVSACLRTRGRPMPTNDVWIASHTEETGGLLISSDPHFNEVAGLSWLTSSAELCD
ncbi:MAG TPA: hypothetical protein VN851_06695 [Thermoanaerobaculia bacterium]|nr:hypothetical protein [Thermoanaerobaculia bacterium]